VAIVAIEGPDGCGKTTQAKLLVQRLKGEGCNAVYVRPVFIISDMLSTSGKSNTNIFPSPRRMRLKQLNSSKKRMNIFVSIRKWLIGIAGYLYGILSYMVMAYYSNRKRIVIGDRYFYQFFFDLFGGSTEKIIRMFPKPDITFLLEGDSDLFYSRMSDPSDVHASKSYYVDVNNLYARISRKYGFIGIDASLDKETINDMIFSHLASTLDKYKGR